MSPAQIAAKLTPEESEALLSAARNGKWPATADIVEPLVRYGIFEPGDLTFILNVTDFGRAVVKELEKQDG